MYNSMNIKYSNLSDRLALYGKTVVVLYDAESVEARQELKRGKHFYRIIAYAGKLYEVMIGLSLSFKIPRAGVQRQAASVFPDMAGREELSLQPRVPRV
jgi:hypothetical protein